MKNYMDFIGLKTDEWIFKLLAQDSSGQSFGLNRSIESMDTEQFSVGVFYFLIVTKD